jgi:urea carboxylase-associated protein 2
MTTTTVMESVALFEEVLAPGATWSHVLKRGTTLRIVDIDGGANVGALFYNAGNPTERYNMPDTLKAQHIARLTEGTVLYSDMGRILCSITADTVGWHDPLSGCSNAVLVARKYGDGTYQERRNDWHQNAFDGFVIELAKHGLELRDMTAPVNFFSKVVVNADGAMTFVPNNSGVGRYVDLRAEMNVLVVLNTCQHPMDPSSTYHPRPAHLAVRTTPPPAFDDPCRLSTPENARGFQLTERYFL